MSEGDDQDGNKGRLRPRPAGRMELGRTLAAGSVRTSFSHGDSKVVQVEVRKSRGGPVGRAPSASEEARMQTPITGTSSAAILGQTLALLRKHKDLTQEDMAKAMNISISSWGRIEKGETDMSVIELSNAAEILGTTPNRILDAAKAGEKDARSKGLKVVAGAGAGTALAGLLAGGGGTAGGVALGVVAGSVIPVVGTLLGGLIGAAIALAMNTSKDK
jgi:DNA-binding XRE family transcriptional regulator